MRRLLVTPAYSPLMLLGFVLLSPVWRSLWDRQWDVVGVGCVLAAMAFLADYLLSRNQPDVPELARQLAAVNTRMGGQLTDLTIRLDSAINLLLDSPAVDHDSDAPSCNCLSCRMARVLMTPR